MTSKTVGMADVDSPDFMYGIELPKAIDIVESSLTGQVLFETGRKLLHLPPSKEVLFETEERSFIVNLRSTTPVTSSTLGCSDSLPTRGVPTETVDPPRLVHN